MNIERDAAGIAGQSRLDLIRERHKALCDQIQATQKEISKELDVDANHGGLGQAEISALPPAPVSVPAPAVAPVGKRADGLTARQVVDIPTMLAIWNDHYQVRLSYEKIEHNPAYGLRHARGMTAYRICRKYEAISGTVRPDA